jgi:hypothetical protein
MPDVSSNAPADVRLWVSLDVHKLSIVAASLWAGSLRCSRSRRHGPRCAVSSSGWEVLGVWRFTRSLSSPLAIESLRGDIGVESHHTAKARLRDLVFAYLAWPCHRREGDTPKLSAQSKYYFIDPLLARLASLRSQGALAGGRRLGP